MRLTRTVNRPSKKNMLRQVWRTMEDAPHGGMRDRLCAYQRLICASEIKATYTVASRPPKAPAMDAAETKIPIRSKSSLRL
ncbi:hypothetical protein IG631_22474 [Alternaria alternata]|nr:hypothetical protein IG631_22474 [Alternaria alternata]